MGIFRNTKIDFEHKNKPQTTYRNHNISVHNNDVKCSILRKSKTFIKSRFSRNRQTCRPIVYWALWLNIAFLGLSQLAFYGFKFSVGYSTGTFIFIATCLILKRLPRHKQK